MATNSIQNPRLELLLCLPNLGIFDRINKHCRICTKKVQRHSKTVYCSLCKSYSHNDCLTLYLHTDIDYTKEPTNNWSCPTCLSELFPFANIEDQHELDRLITSHTTNDYSHLDNLLFNPLDLNEKEGGGDVLDEIDPDKNYYNDPQLIIPNSQYLYHDSINKKIETNKE
jgi:hypothetical protein